MKYLLPLLALLAIMIMGGESFAQIVPAPPPVGVKQAWCDDRCKASIAVYVAGSAMDVASSWGQRELNPLARDSEGNFVPWKGAALKAGHLGLTLAWQKKYPKAMFWARIVVGAFYAGVAVRNWNVPGRR